MQAQDVKRALAALAAAALVVFLAACSIHESKGENGESKKVDIETPFGGIHVNANDVDPKTVGMAVYPGSQSVQDRHDNKNATVDINSSFFGLKVVALKYKTSDPPDKVLDFYRKELKSYGDVLECKGQNEINSHTKPGESRPLSCKDEDHGAHINIDTDSTQLKVGTTDRQHVVEVKPSGGGTEYSLVYVQTRGKHDSM